MKNEIAVYQSENIPLRIEVKEAKLEEVESTVKEYLIIQANSKLKINI